MDAVLPGDDTWTVVDPDGAGGDSIDFVVGPPAYTGAFNEGVSASPDWHDEIGAGSALFTNADPADPSTLPELVTHEADGTRFLDVAEFGWATFVAPDSDGAVPYIVVDVDLDGDGPGEDVITLVADDDLDRWGELQEAHAGRWQFWRAQPGDDVWDVRVDGVDSDYDMVNMPADATIAGVRLSLGVAAPTGDSYADAVRIEPVADEAGSPFDRYAWSFEPGEDVTVVFPATLASVSGQASPAVRFVAGPDGVGAVELAYSDGTEPEALTFSEFEGLPVSMLDAFTMTSWVDPQVMEETEACNQPTVLVAVDVDGDFATGGIDDLENPDDLVLLTYSPCFSGIVGPPTIGVEALETAVEEPPAAGWMTWDVRSGLTLMNPMGGGYEMPLDEFLSDPATQSARITDLSRFGSEAITGGIAFTSFDYSVVYRGESDESVEDVTTVPPALLDRAAIGIEGDHELQALDFVPTSGGGGTFGYTITVPAGGGTGSTALPGGNGSITTDGNADGGTFTLVPGGDPAGTPGNFQVLGQSWNITPPAGFDFDGAEVCLPYDEAALTAAGYDEGDLALVHYAADGTLEDITTSIDTVNDIICGATDSFSPFAIGILDVDRLAGADRAATAAAISAATFEPGAPVAYIATGEAFADALAGGPAAAADDGPVLLVDDSGIPAATATELARLQPGRIVVLGGTAAVADEILDGLEGMTDGAVTRLAGADRYATAAEVSKTSFDAGADVVYVATGQQFADALTGGAAAARDGAPVLLVSPTSIPASVGAELERLDPSQIVVLGGTAAVSDGVVDQLGAIAPVTRLSGTDRYGTAAAVAATFTAPTDSLFVATGTAFPDALTGVPAAGRAQSPIVLVDGALPASTDAQVRRLDPASMRILGGTAAIADTVVDLLRDSMLN